MLEAKYLTAIRNERVLFRSISFQINFGEFVQIEGRNGVGKTTLLRIIVGLSSCEDGEVYWNSNNIKDNRNLFYKDLLFIGHKSGIKQELTVFENLSFYQNITQSTSNTKKEIYYSLMKAGLSGNENSLVAQLSFGQQRRVALARLLLSKQKLWILDEPMIYLDQQGINIFQELFLRHIENGGIIILTTHQNLFRNNIKLRKIKLGNNK
ncbi:cytochrome c biogenesis ATP-binding export protein [Candidatus Photodesmus katoptron]|uniref:Heme ABC exporter, ATP-binding protein CcmA n=1 Tax=Candidatus Photodesmus katoptron Akat1 TaxID=1236703 RepID=S3EHN8_9GAMM|nr:cytochrome c biogenesis heme-transporting ATPase CcmA [Candidatus Photodesmus katoptron]EPE37698.1 heme ABC exporter, ATP-binding protein CcmA [Candidatus Photodesmus katoptron Akat1]KEY90581.1 cytochrome c biogenesis ATP-binding export protein [Candidatus Photodesmus katoptron]